MVLNSHQQLFTYTYLFSRAPTLDTDIVKCVSVQNSKVQDQDNRGQHDPWTLSRCFQAIVGVNEPPEAVHQGRDIEPIKYCQYEYPNYRCHGARIHEEVKMLPVMHVYRRIFILLYFHDAFSYACLVHSERGKGEVLPSDSRVCKSTIAELEDAKQNSGFSGLARSRPWTELMFGRKSSW